MRDKLLSTIRDGCVKESRTIILYAVPTALLVWGLRHLGCLFPLLLVAITSIVFVVIIAIEDRDTLDTKFNSFVVRFLTCICFYYLTQLASYYIFEVHDITTIYKNDKYLFQLIMLFDDYIKFVISIALFRIFFICFLGLLYGLSIFIARILPV